MKNVVNSLHKNMTVKGLLCLLSLLCLCTPPGACLKLPLLPSGIKFRQDPLYFRNSLDPLSDKFIMEREHTREVLKKNLLAVALGVGLIWGAGGVEMQADAVPSRLLAEARDFISFNIYDNGGGARESMTPAGVSAAMKRISRDTSLGETDQVKELVKSLGDPFSEYIPPDSKPKPSNYGFLNTGASLSYEKKDALLPFNLALYEGPSRTNVPRYQSYPVVTTILPSSPAERAGLTVGTRVISVADSLKLVQNTYAEEALERLQIKSEEVFGVVKMRVALPIYDDDGILRGYGDPRSVSMKVSAEKGDHRAKVEVKDLGNGVIYARLPAFTHRTTSELVAEISAFDKAAVTGVIVDLRNNYGGVVQDALMVAASIMAPLPEDRSSASDIVMMYTLNSRSSFRPHPVEDYMDDPRFPGYFMSLKDPGGKEMQRRIEKFRDPSGYQSLGSRNKMLRVDRKDASKKGGINHPPIVLLVNEGTASSAEVFASALRDNGHATIVGSKTFGKGLIQHVFKLSNGGMLKLTVGEYLTPKLQHVTNVGGARYGEEGAVYRGGGIKPDVKCDTWGIPKDKAADICVEVAMGQL